MEYGEGGGFDLVLFDQRGDVGRLEVAAKRSSVMRLSGDAGFKVSVCWCEEMLIKYPVIWTLATGGRSSWLHNRSPSTKKVSSILLFYSCLSSSDHFKLSFNVGQSFLTGTMRRWTLMSIMGLNNAVPGATSAKDDPIVQLLDGPRTNFLSKLEGRKAGALDEITDVEEMAGMIDKLYDL
ncbi:hypothetical protein MA16_Dca003255 [Dendrobium catenatum]|uniref:Uncharacterized protein n=1 Tax=Dendrobium catenatum TaxID=906689 RepID=A0A2I0XC78_9ASPA|nr:hypothetical protein MA16_Dca003255 [Dendrobium catenatum]